MSDKLTARMIELDQEQRQQERERERVRDAAEDLFRIVSHLQMWLEAGGQLPSASTQMEDSEETFAEAIDAAIAKATGDE